LISLGNFDFVARNRTTPERGADAVHH